MKIKVEATKAELEEMGLDSAEELAEQLQTQLDDAVYNDQGGVGGDWLADYTISVNITG